MPLIWIACEGNFCSSSWTKIGKIYILIKLRAKRWNVAKIVCVCQWRCAKIRNNAWSEMIEICIGFSHLWIFSFSFSCFVIRSPSSSFHVAFFLTQAINDTSIKREVNVKKLSYLHASWCRKPKFCSDHFVWDSFFCCCCCWLL